MRPSGAGSRGIDSDSCLDFAENMHLVIGSAGYAGRSAIAALSAHFPVRGVELSEDLGAAMAGVDTVHLATDLQIGHVGVEVDPIQALQIQPYLPVEHVVDRHRCGHNRQPGRPNDP